MRRNASQTTEQQQHQLDEVASVFPALAKTALLTYDNATPFTPSTRRNQYTGQRFTTHASSLSALSSLPRELLEPVVAVDDVLVLVVDVDGVVS